jgi:hypothetical protein
MTTLLRTSPLVICIVLLACKGSTLSNTGTTTSGSMTKSQVQQSTPDRRIGPGSSAEELIWAGETAGYKIRWTTRDLYVESGIRTERIWSPFVEKGFEDFIATYTSNAKRPGRKIEDCTYDRRLTVLSVVGTLVSFEDEYGDYCGGAHPSEDFRFVTVDLSKSGEISYARQVSTPMMNIDMADPGRIVRLTDYFREEDILHALLADRVIQEAVGSLSVNSSPRNLREFDDLLGKQGYILGGSGLALSRDFLTRFAFHHLKGDKVAVRLSLSSASTANQSEREQIGLLLSMPERLAAPLHSASTARLGFLMKDAGTIAHGKATVFSFPQ